TPCGNVSWNFFMRRWEGRSLQGVTCMRASLSHLVGIISIAVVPLLLISPRDIFWEDTLLGRATFYLCVMIGSIFLWVIGFGPKSDLTSEREANSKAARDAVSGGRRQ